MLQLKWGFYLKINGSKFHVDEMPIYLIAFSFRDFIFKMKLNEVLFSSLNTSFLKAVHNCWLVTGMLLRKPMRSRKTRYDTCRVV